MHLLSDAPAPDHTLHVLWDHDGVIVDTEPVFFEATARVLGEHGVDVDHAAWVALQAQGQGIVRLIRDGGLAASEAEIRRVRDEVYAELLAERDVMIDGARGVVEVVTARHPSAMVTTSLRRYVDQMHGHTGLLDHFAHVVTAEDCRRHKPHPEPYLKAMERLGASPDGCVAIEDSPRGLAAAKAAGVRCAVVRTDFMANVSFRDADAVLETIEEFPDWLASLS